MTQPELTAEQRKNVSRGVLLLMLVLVGVPTAILVVMSRGALLLLAVILVPIVAGIAGFRPKLMAWITPLLFLFLFSPPGCALVGSHPQLLFDPISAAIYRAPPHPERPWRSVDVDLSADLPTGSALEPVAARLARAGFKFDGEHDLEWRTAFGYTHSFSQGGRTQWACGETMFVNVVLGEGGLIKAVGHSQWTCL